MRKSNKDIYFKGSVDDFHESKGWFVGQFMGEYGYPKLRMDDVEVCWKVLSKGFSDPLHYHKRGVEIAIMINGWFSALVNGHKEVLREKEFLVVYPETKLEVIDFKNGTEFVLIKTPSVPDDKYFV